MFRNLKKIVQLCKNEKNTIGHLPGSDEPLAWNITNKNKCKPNIKPKLVLHANETVAVFFYLPL